MLVTYNLLQ